MEANKLTIFALSIVMVGMIVGIGVLIFDKMSTNDSVTQLETITLESFTYPNNASNVSLAHGNLSSFTQIQNASGTVLGAVNYTVDLVNGRITANQNTTICVTGATCKASYIWRNYETASADILQASRDATGDIADTWLTLVVTVGVLAVILSLVVGAFAIGRKR